jgi:hypothetical protein
MINNIHELPEPLVKALTPDRKAPVDGRISVTALIDSPLRRILQKRYFNQIEEDASENLWALLGSAIHKVIEMGSEDTEIKLEIPYGGATVVGVVDYYKDSQIIDWKCTSVWSVVFADNKLWEQQLQVYAYLVQLSGKPVDKLSVYMILRDWNKREAQRNPEMPKIPFHQISYPIWPKYRIEAYLTERVCFHLAAEKYSLDCPSSDLPPQFWCTPEERWHKPDKWAAKNIGKDRAVRVFDTKEECEKFVLDTKMFLEYRPGQDSKCLDYCNTALWCPYLKTTNDKG